VAAAAEKSGDGENWKLGPPLRTTPRAALLSLRRQNQAAAASGRKRRHHAVKNMKRAERERKTRSSRKRSKLRMRQLKISKTVVKKAWLK
jgi:hypothetical protein